jgi:transmembrane sensor
MGKGLVNVAKTADEITDEAAAWLARLNADRRTLADEAAFQAWLAESPAHQTAFEEATMVWELAGGMPHDMLHDMPRTSRIGRREVLAGLTVGAAVASGFVFLGSRAEAKVYETQVGERRRVVFEDNSIATLDTDTRIAVKFSDVERLVDLQRGRVNFHVRADGKRPFIVSGAKETIVAHQSNFDVRRDGENISVVLIDGRASVDSGGKMAVLEKGDRLVTSADGTHLDKPSLLPLLAWQKGQAILENEKLSDAVAEMNRYSAVKLAIDDKTAAELRVSGVYKVGDNLGFARSIARLLPLRVEQTDGKVLLRVDTDRMRQG